MMKPYLLLVLLFRLSHTENEDAGIKGRITLKGFTYGLQAGIQELKSRLASIHIPDVSGSVKVPVIGHVTYLVTQLQIENLDLSEQNVFLSTNTGVQLSVNKGQISVTGELSIKTFLFSAKARMNLLVRDLSFSAVIGITRDDLGHGVIWDAGCSSNVGHVDLSFHGGAGWLLDMFRNAMLGPIYDALSKQLCPEFDKTVMQVGEIMRHWPVSWRVDSVSAVEFPLVVPPNITELILELGVKGEFVGIAQRWEAPFPPEKFVLPDIDSRMLLLGLSQFTVNSAGYVHYKSGFLRANVTDDMIPKESPLRLNIKSLGIYAPELPTRFPDSPPVLLQISASSPPFVSCQSNALTVQVATDIQIFAMNPKQQLAPLFQLQSDGEFQVDLLLSEQSLGAQLAEKKTTQGYLPFSYLQLTSAEPYSTTVAGIHSNCY
ncbi:bactericidal permeability-increasing protein isoform X2 [Bombina bombina]|uniref:bactericidal permeability-increasing protein isoform X2 n=1 Tax=Bombina bombina TaxID=8345 RepID=UPI00235AEF4B|nr:bactericidal permeability-increasing protein isoform X2 [Bombina bombina]